jgi:hypothetical protein
MRRLMGHPNPINSHLGVVLGKDLLNPVSSVTAAHPPNLRPTPVTADALSSARHSAGPAVVLYRLHA